MKTMLYFRASVGSVYEIWQPGSIVTSLTNNHIVADGTQDIRNNEIDITAPAFTKLSPLNCRLI